MFFKNTWITIKILIVVILKSIAFNIEKKLRENTEEEDALIVSDYKVYIKVDPNIKTKNVEDLAKVIALNDQDYATMIVNNVFVNGFNKRGFTQEQAMSIRDRLKDDPMIKVDVVAIIQIKGPQYGS